MQDCAIEPYYHKELNPNAPKLNDTIDDNDDRMTHPESYFTQDGHGKLILYCIQL
ncbi:hypothetical protein [Candidatus Nitrosocosmicus hydrocola]|uniref:hypothetical protein n=1 Tax=Candidatus Nitrosocosmicus hydrocola TaxID=1826872 RepID=UPI0013729148|nr:hypothetical protein [Candidatus Nitrosocosmicus hydrocola]